ncbi:MAG TPA: glycosyltransferase family 4 protein [Chthoniobacteraceae bacterium]|jgi:glycosyltransferase involved in cell wall biosynthesis|nr:glycosyltransferase family 4 protein [Chthoniobacteraceae bacterium]
MRILFVHDIAGNFGGAESNLYDTADGLRRRGHTIGLLAHRGSGKGEAAWQALFGENLFFQNGEDPCAVARRFGAEVIYMHKWDEPDGIEALLRSGVPMVRMVHDHDIHCLRSYRYNPLTRRICTRPAGHHCVFPCLAPLKRSRAGGLPVHWVGFMEKRREMALSRRFHRNIVATKFMREELLINRFPPAAIEIIPPVPRHAEPLESNFSARNLLVFAGQIIRGKGVDVMLRALAKVRAPFEMVILGAGNHRAACERLGRRLGLGSRVAFKGFVPQEELRQFYQEATAVLFPSVWPEPMGLSGLEAMRNGLPVVGFDAGGVGDWLRDGENGFLVPWMDIDRYASSIDALLADKELARAMGRRGRERFLADYDFDRYIGRIEAVFHRMLGGHKAAA